MMNLKKITTMIKELNLKDKHYDEPKKITTMMNDNSYDQRIEPKR